MGGIASSFILDLTLLPPFNFDSLIFDIAALRLSHVSSARTGIELYPSSGKCSPYIGRLPSLEVEIKGIPGFTRGAGVGAGVLDTEDDSAAGVPCDWETDFTRFLATFLGGSSLVLEETFSADLLGLARFMSTCAG